MLINKYLPEYHFNEYHAIRIDGSNEEILDAIKSLRKNEISPIMIFLMRIRLFTVEDKDSVRLQNEGLLLDEMQKNKFFILDESENEIVTGLIGKFWMLTNPNEIQINSTEEYQKFSNGEYGIVAFNFLVKQEKGNNLLTTETRIKIDDPKSRRKFAIYWFFIYLGSSLIRMVLLKAIKRKVELEKK